jgi:hypothetical protein
LAALLFSLSFLFVAQANQTHLIHALQAGTFQESRDALEQILNIPSTERTEQLWLALADRLESEQAREHQKLDAFLAGSKIPDDGIAAEDNAQYLGDLVTALGQWHDPRALPALISAAGRASEEIIQFGDRAVAPLITAARQGHHTEQGDVVYALQLLLERRPEIVTPPLPLPPAAGGGPSPFARIEPAQLSPQSGQQIRDLARDLLKPRALKLELVEVTLLQVSNLALATGDADLLQKVHMLVDSPSHLSDTTGITDPNKLLDVQDGIRAVLAEHKQ